MPTCFPSSPGFDSTRALGIGKTGERRIPRTPEIAAVKQKSHDVECVAADSFFGLFVLATPTL